MRAIGSAYLLRQSPGSEAIGGLQVTLRRRQGEVGTIVVNPTDWLSDESHAKIDYYISQAMVGINEIATEYAIPLEDFDVELSGFLIHDVDSHPRAYYLAAKAAFRTALEMWKFRELSR